MLRTIRYAQIFPLLCAVCHLTVAFPTQTPSAKDDVQSLKWTVVSGGVETQILVARGQRVKVNEAYRDRAALLNYTSSLDDLSLWLGDLRSSDSGHYRCEVQQGLEDASDLVELKVKGVVFHYRDASGRYAFSYHHAQRACEAIGAEIATPDQLLAAYYDGYEQCDAGWLADQSVRYPIQVPREGCYGDMDGQPGVRNYGTMDPDDLFDVYCYVEQIDGEVFYDSVPQQLSFDEAEFYCRVAGAELATTAQLYLAWSEGLDRCSPGWLSDGSVRYPIITPRDRCGGPQAGVKTLYRFSNQTGFPEAFTLHDVYCFKDNRNTPSDSPMYTGVRESEDLGQDVVILTERDQELQLLQHAEQVEREAQSALESFPFFSSPSTAENLLGTDTTVISDATESPLNTTSTLDILQPFDKTSSPSGTSPDSQHPTEVTISSLETSDLAHNTSLLSSVYNETDSHHNVTFTSSPFELESTTGFLSHETQTQNQTMPDTTPEEHTRPSQRLQEINETNLELKRSQANYTEGDSNHTQEENIEKLEEAAGEDPVQMSLSTQLPKEQDEVHTQTTQSPIKQQTSLWFPTDGSGDISQETDLDSETSNKIFTSSYPISSVPTHPSPSASASSVTTGPLTTVPETTVSTGSQNTETETPEGLNTSQFPTDSTTTRYGTSGYREYLDNATTAYEEASGQEPGIITATLEEDAEFGPAIEKDLEVGGEVVTVAPHLEEEMNISSTVKEQANISFSHENDIKITTTLAIEEESPNLEEGAHVTPPLEEENTEEEREAKMLATTQEDFSLHSATSDRALLTPTTGSQESVKDLEYSRKHPSVTTSVAPDSSSVIRSNTATMRTTTNRSRHTWSPTPTTRAFHKTTGTQRVTHLIPPVDQGLVDVEFSLTQPPTLLILPNERASVSGAGKVSDACVDDPCLNGGTCTDRDGQVKCLCLPSYGGDFCQTDLERCEPGWDKFHGFCYRHFSQRLSWEVAEKHCRVLGAHLVSIMSPEEQIYINSNYKEYQWTGLNDKTIEDDFRWSDGSPLLYENWYRGQPDSYFLSGEDCVVMVWHDDGRWSDVPCNYHLAYTCKKGTSSCGPPPKVRNASLFGKVRQRYDTSAVVRYHCDKGFQQRQNPLIRCLSGGRWERPQILCIPEGGLLLQQLEITSPTESNVAAMEDELEATKDSPQYWDIKF
ncbi:hypothetical protein Q5P01_018409 [Channa striata]|uniref:Brevican core protein-like n=1 Tax=Channa striata TaxID=64152 RepID=A0AA88M6P3_CHASR|nr:hypothetical protein Q5P01_018409 [Channa striata]